MVVSGVWGQVDVELTQAQFRLVRAGDLLTDSVITAIHANRDLLRQTVKKFSC